LIAPVALLLINSTAAQDADAMSRWGEKIGDVLVHFLPSAAAVIC